jgi:REP element-mobilizing transposase RayT
MLWQSGPKPNYLRPCVTEGTVIFSVRLAARGGDMLVREVARLCEAVVMAIFERPFLVEARVVLPDHMHAIWQRRFWDHHLRDPGILTRICGTAGAIRSGMTWSSGRRIGPYPRSAVASVSGRVVATLSGAIAEEQYGE